MDRLLRISLAALLCLLLGSATARAGEVVVDSGFRPDPDGFSFPNYSGDIRYAELDELQVQRLFGRSVCLTGRGRGCVLLPAMQRWMETRNKDLQGGHCFGFATLSSLIFRGLLHRFGFDSIWALGGGPGTFDLKIDGNVVLQRTLARAWVTFNNLDLQKRMVLGKPSRIVRFLIENLRDRGEYWTISIYNRSMTVGHAVTPYAVEDLGGGKYAIHIYDNNWPGDLTRRIAVDTNEETWSYYLSPNPDVPEDLFEGDAGSNSMFLQPATSSLGIEPCPYCSGRRGIGRKFNEISLSSPGSAHSHLLITDRKGRQTGFRRGRLLNQIPGARVVPVPTGASVLASTEPTYLIPKKAIVRIRVSSGKRPFEGRESLNVIGPAFDAAVDDLEMGRGRVGMVRLDPRRETLDVTGSGGRSAPAASFGAVVGKTAMRISVGEPTGTRDSYLRFDRNPGHNELVVSSKSRNRRSYEMALLAEGPNGSKAYEADFRLSRSQRAVIRYASAANGALPSVLLVGASGRKIRTVKATLSPIPG